MSRKTYSMQDGYQSTDLLQYARDHLYAASFLYPQGARCLDSASILSHVAIELLLKAVLLNETGSFPKEHRLSELYKDVRASSPENRLDVLLERILPLLDKLFHARYPTPVGAPTVAQGDWPVIQHIASEIESWLPKSIRNTPNNDVARFKGGRRLINQPED
jgi:HEPN domain-containing protein